MSRNRKWTQQEDERLLRQVKAFPQNLHKCFLIVSEEIARSPKAVAAHWYTSLSKRPEVLAFGTISPVHFSRNRKNGMGIPITRNIWQRFVRLVRSIV